MNNYYKRKVEILFSYFIFVIMEHKCGGWLYTNNEAFDEIVSHLSNAEALIALSDDVYFEEEDQLSLLKLLSKMKVKLNKISKYVK